MQTADRPAYAAQRKTLLQLDIAQFKVGTEGVENFYWPLPRAELLTARDAMVSAAVAVLRDAANAEPRAEDLGGSVFAPLVTEYFVVIQAQILARRAKAAKARIRTAPASRHFAPVADGRAPGRSPFLRILAAGPARPVRWRAPLRLVRSLLVQDGILREPLANPDYERDVVAISAGGLLSEHAHRVQDRVIYQPLNKWFGPLPHVPASEAWERDLADALAESVRTGCAAVGETLPDFLGAYCWSFAQEAVASASAHQRRLHGQPVPARLWTGLSTQVWGRLLAYAVRRDGGHVTAHDHGTGTGHIRSPFKTLIDLWSCDRFVTFNEAQARALRADARPDLLVRPNVPEIVALRGRAAAGKTAAPAVRTSAAAASRTILYVTTVYPGDTPILDPSAPDLVAVDWQARVIAHLRARGLRVLLKPHPESAAPPPPAFAQDLGAKVLAQPFERVTALADVILSDFALSSTFGAALRSGRPLVLVDFGYAPFTPEALAMLQRRCAIVPGRFDGENRAAVDWARLDDALTRSLALSDDSFVRTYLERS